MGKKDDMKFLGNLSKTVSGRLPNLNSISKVFRENLLNVKDWKTEVEAGCKAFGKRYALVKPIIEVFPQESVIYEYGKESVSLVYVVVAKCNLTGMIGIFIDGVFQYIVKANNADFENRVLMRRIPSLKEAMKSYIVLYYNPNLLKDTTEEGY